MSTWAEKKLRLRARMSNLYLRKEKGLFQVRTNKGRELTGWIPIEEVDVYIKLVNLREHTGFKSGMSLTVDKGKGIYTLTAKDGIVLVKKKSLKDLGDWIDSMIEKHAGDRVWIIPEDSAEEDSPEDSAE